MYIVYPFQLNSVFSLLSTPSDSFSLLIHILFTCLSVFLNFQYTMNLLKLPFCSCHLFKSANFLAKEFYIHLNVCICVFLDLLLLTIYNRHLFLFLVIFPSLFPLSFSPIHDGWSYVQGWCILSLLVLLSGLLKSVSGWLTSAVMYRDCTT